MLNDKQPSPLKLFCPASNQSSPSKPLNLSPNTPYLNFDLELTEEQNHYLQTLDITNFSSYFDNDGDIDNLTITIKKYLQQLGKNDDKACTTIAEAIASIAKKIISYFNQETAWVTIRTFPENSAFTLPRWHTDGRYYEINLTNPQYKAAIALRGPSTLFYNLPQEQRELFNHHQKNQDRQALSQMINIANAETSPFGQGAIFVVGDKETAAVHSEPDMANMEQPRIFFSVLPGSKTQILEYYKIQEEARMAHMSMKK